MPTSTKQRREELVASITDGFTRAKKAKYIAEFIGTAWLVLLIKLSVPNFIYPSIAIGGGLCAIIYTYGYVSYAHYNPSITLAFTIRNMDAWPRSDTCQILMYYVVEYVGAICGGCIGWLIGGNESAMVYPTALNNGSSLHVLLRAFTAEFIFTFVLAAVILHVATDERQAKNQFYGISIGLTVTVSIMCIGSISGCCLNSAVWVGCVVPAVLASMMDSDSPNMDLSDAWIYWIAPFAGAALSAFVFNSIFAVPAYSRGYSSTKVIDDADKSAISLCEQIRNTEDGSVIIYEK